MPTVDHYISGTRLRLRRIEFPSGETQLFKLGQKYQATDQETHQTILTNIYLNEAEYKAMAALGGSTITKRCYPYHYTGHDYSIDVFDGNLVVLVLAEIERQSEGDISTLPVPEFAVREITDDPMFTGGEFAELSKDQFKAWLAAW